MTFPRVRFTVRRMMVAVAIAAVATGCVTFWKRSTDFHRLADQYGQLESDESAWLSSILEHQEWTKKHGRAGIPFDLPPVPPSELLKSDAEIIAEIDDEAKRRREKIEWYRPRRLKYERAARYPWLPVAPDPPEPE